MTLKILTVDDSPSIRQMIIFSLKPKNYLLREASDGQEALDMIKCDPPDMLITDLNMPRMDGIRLIRQTRMVPGCRRIPIIILTTESESHKKKQAKLAGASGWITKPFTPRQLTAVVDKLVALP